MDFLAQFKQLDSKTKVQIFQDIEKHLKLDAESSMKVLLEDIKSYINDNWVIGYETSYNEDDNIYSFSVLSVLKTPIVRSILLVFSRKGTGDKTDVELCIGKLGSGIIEIGIIEIDDCSGIISLADAKALLKTTKQKEMVATILKLRK